MNSKYNVIEKHTDEGHFYQDKDSGVTYPSVTTVLKALYPAKEQTWYKGWTKSVMNKNDMTEDEAIEWCDAYSGRSMEVGTKMHNLAELYANDKLPKTIRLKKGEEYETDPRGLFTALKGWLDVNVETYSSTEARIFDPEIELAGTVDLVATLQSGERAIIDYKNSRKPKAPGKIRDSRYYEQMCAYSKMWKHCTGETIEKGIVVVVSWDLKVRAFETHLPDHEDALMTLLDNYREYKYLNNIE